MDFSPMIVTVGPSPMNEPAVLSQLVGIPVTQLDRSAFTYRRYLYRDGSFIVLIFDTCSDRIVSMSAQTRSSFTISS